MHVYHSHWILMTPEHRAWLKRPTRHTLAAIAKEHGYIVKTFHWNGFDDRLVTMFKDGKPVYKGKANVFAIEDAIALIKKRESKP